jgi:hypothetical protein
LPETQATSLSHTDFASERLSSHRRGSRSSSPTTAHAHPFSTTFLVLNRSAMHIHLTEGGKAREIATRPRAYPGMCTGDYGNKAMVVTIDPKLITTPVVATAPPLKS